MTLHNTPECPHCHQRSIIRVNFHDWQCLSCGFKRDFGQPPIDEQAMTSSLFPIAWAIASAFLLMALMGVMPELPSLRLRLSSSASNIGSNVGQSIVIGSPDNAPITLDVITRPTNAQR